MTKRLVSRQTTWWRGDAVQKKKKFGKSRPMDSNSVVWSFSSLVQVTKKGEGSAPVVGGAMWCHVMVAKTAGYSTNEFQE